MDDHVGTGDLRRSGAGESAADAADQGTGRALREPVAGIERGGRRTGAESGGASGENGVHGMRKEVVTVVKKQYVQIMHTLPNPGRAVRPEGDDE